MSSLSSSPHPEPLPALRLVDVPRATPRAPETRRSWRERYRRRLRATDVSTVVALVAAAALAPLDGRPAAFGLSASATVNALVGVLVLTAWLTALSAFRTRDPRVIGAGATEYKRVVGASLTAFGLLAIVFLFAHADVSRKYLAIAIPIGVTTLVLERWAWRQWLLTRRADGHYLSRAIVVGARDDIAFVVTQIGASLGAGYAVVGAIADSRDEGDVVVGAGRVPVVGHMHTVADAARRLHADVVIVAGQPRGGGNVIRELGWQLEGTETELVISNRLADIAGPRIHFRPVDGLPLIHVEVPNYEGGRHALKRTLDVVLSAIAIVALAPLFLAIAIAVKVDSRGPVFFRQERCGRGGETFRMVKFRSMVTTAESDLAALRALNEGSGLLFKLRNDPRVTRVGRVLRTYSLDELPQIWNILIGDMSIVGPRPPLPSEVRAYEGDVHRRLYIKPGLTGMWQINGRSDLSWEESVRLDLYYVENWSLTGDLVIMWRTLKVLLHPNGAY
ncbi:sugar transferase [Rathayibacter sp. YIM 133350]|uniref:sugar transferase n=1 Tax=Rathayibacter sp. YIM 133350 TaxID=3131992 RepID=UPI00307F4C3D